MKPDLEEELAEEPSQVETVLASATENQRWDPIGGTTGERILPLHGDDEDDDGLPPSAGLVEAGVNAAEFDQMIEADKADPEEEEDVEPLTEEEESDHEGDEEADEDNEDVLVITPADEDE